MSALARRFCMVTTFYPPFTFGGDGIFVYRLSNELARRGHRVDVVHCADAYRLLSPRVPRDGEYPNHPLVTVHALQSRAGALSPLITHQTGYPGLKAPHLHEILDGGRYDVIHFHNISLIGPAALSYGTGVKLYTLHEHWLVCPIHVLWKFNRAPCSRKHCIPCTIHAGRPPQLWRYTPLMGKMLEHVDAFIAPSRFTRRKHHEMGLDVDAPIIHIPHFLPPPTSSAPPGVDDDPPHFRPYFLFAGRLEKIKGVQVLIDVFRRFAGGDLLIAGTGSYESHLRRLARGLSHVVFLGHLNYQRLQVLLRHAIAVVIPSVGYEVFPMIVLEAFAQGTPVVAHDLGPLPEIIAQSGGGLTYQGGAELAAALEQLRSDVHLRRTLGERGYRAYLKFWTPEPHLRRYLHLIDSIERRKQTTLQLAGDAM